MANIAFVHLDPRMSSRHYSAWSTHIPGGGRAAGMNWTEDGGANACSARKRKLPRRVEWPGESAPGENIGRNARPPPFSPQDQRVEVKAEQGLGNHFSDEFFRK